MTAPPLIDVTGARRRRARARLKRRFTIVGVLVALLGLVGAGIWLVGWSGVFAAEAVSVEGVKVLSADEVIGAAQVPLGTSLMAVDGQATAARVEALPAVDQASVRLQPPHTVVIAVTERTAVLVVGTGSPYTWVDANGVAFHTSQEPPKDVISAHAALSNGEVLSAMATVAEALPPQIRSEVTGMSAATRDSIKLTLTNGRTVIWGSAEESEFKAEVLSPLLGVDAKVYDVSAPAHPTTR